MRALAAESRQPLGVEVEADTLVSGRRRRVRSAGSRSSRRARRTAPRSRAARHGVQVPAEGTSWPVRRAGSPSTLSSSVFARQERRGGERAAPELDSARPAAPARGNDDERRRHAEAREEEDEGVREQPEDLLAHEFRPTPRLARPGEGAKRQGLPLRPGSARVRRRACPTRSRAARRAVCRPRRT